MSDLATNEFTKRLCEILELKRCTKIVITARAGERTNLVEVEATILMDCSEAESMLTELKRFKLEPIE